MPLEDRIWAMVDRRGDDECWPWTGATNKAGYGMYGGGSRSVGGRGYAHRFIAGAEKGEVVRHTCDNPPCCNPRHLVRGTQQENMDDMVAKERSRSGERNPRAELTAGDVEAIRRDGRSSYAVSQDYPVSARTVRKIRQGTRWKGA